MLENVIPLLKGNDVIDMAICKSNQIKRMDFSNIYNKLYPKSNKYYQIFKIGDDRVIAIFKIGNMYSKKYCRLIGSPISLSGVLSNEFRVLNYLRENKLITDFILSDDDLARHDIDVINSKVSERDFYYDISSLKSKIDRGKWRSKHSITKYKSDLSFRVATLDDFHEISHLYDMWAERKGKSLASKSLYKNYIKNFDKYYENTLVVTYQCDIIGFSVWDSFHNKAQDTIQGSKIIEIHYMDDMGIDLPKQLLNNLSYIMLYYTMRYLDNKNYIGFNVGTATSDTLQDFKRRYCDREIKYYKIINK